MYWYIYCLKNYANFSGRGRRKEYWTFLLFNILIIIGLVFLAGMFEENSVLEEVILVLLGLYGLFIIIPHLAAVARRLHDTNRSAWYWFVRFIPLIGVIWLLVLLVEDSAVGANKWGENPKDVGNDGRIDQIGKE